METTAIKNLLVVDDNEDTLRLINLVVTNKYKDIRIFTALTSKEAINLFNAEPFDAVVLDVSLPDITGAYLGDVIKKSCPNIPMAFLTNYNGEVTKENAESIGADFWYKPDLFKDINNLSDKIHSLVNSNTCEQLNKIAIPSIIKDNG